MAKYVFTIGIPLNLKSAIEAHLHLLDLLEVLVESKGSLNSQVEKLIFFNSSALLSADCLQQSTLDLESQHKLFSVLLPQETNLLKAPETLCLWPDFSHFPFATLQQISQRYISLVQKGCELLVCGQNFKHYVQPYFQLNPSFKLTGFMEILATLKQDVKVINW